MDANKSSGVSKEREQQIERISRCLPCHLKSFRQLGKPENSGKLSQLTFDNLKEIDSVAISFYFRVKWFACIMIMMMITVVWFGLVCIIMMMITVVVGEIDCVGSHWREGPCQNISNENTLQVSTSRLHQSAWTNTQSF